MNFLVYSVGDCAFLAMVLDTITMITGSGDFLAVLCIGALLSVLIIMIQALFQGAQRINWQQPFLGFMLYSLMFGPTCTVYVEDIYDGGNRHIDNVPIGVGMVGSMISQVGYGLSKHFEIAYQPLTNDTQQHFASSLKLLNDVRRRAGDPAVFVALDTDLGGGLVDSRKSWRNYIQECVLIKIDLGEITLDKMLSGSLSLKGNSRGSGIDEPVLMFDSLNFGTQLWLDPGGPKNYTCTEAWNELVQKTNLESPLVVNALNRIMGVAMHGSNRVLDDHRNVFHRGNTALQMLGATNTAALDFLWAAMVEPIYYEAVEDKHKELHDTAAAIMVNQSIQQRNSQWTAEQSLFMSLFRPFLTFFEGFIYGITPFMAFLMVLGVYGINLVGRYLQTLVWIWLWMPGLSFINRYIHMAVAGEMHRYEDLGVAVNSFYALADLDNVLSHWIAVGGLMAASTPLITLFLVSGSTYAWTQLTQSMKGSDHIDEKTHSPDVTRSAPLMDNEFRYKHNDFSGTHREGTQSLVPKVSFGQDLSERLASAQSSQQQKQKNFARTLGAGFSHDTKDGNTYQKMSDVGRSISTMGSQQARMIQGKTKDFMEQANVASDHENAVRGSLGLLASGNLSAKAEAGVRGDLLGMANTATGAGTAGRTKGGSVGIDGGLGIKGESATITTDKTQYSASDVTKFANSLRLEDSESQSLNNELAEHYKDSQSQTFQDTWGQDYSRKLTNTASQLVSANQNFSRENALVGRISQMTNTDYKTFAADVAKSVPAQSRLDAVWNRVAAGNQAMQQHETELFNRYHGRSGMDTLLARNAARMIAMTGIHNPEQEKGYHEVANVAGLAMGVSAPLDGSAYAHQHLTQQTPDTETVMEDVNQATRPAQTLGADGRKMEDTVRQAGTDPISQASTLPTTGSGVVLNENNQKQASVEENSRKASQSMTAQHEAKNRFHVLQPLEHMSKSAQMWGQQDNFNDWLKRASQKHGGGIGAGLSEGSDKLFELTDRLKTMTPDQRQNFVQTLEQKDDNALKQDFGWATEVASKLGRDVVGGIVKAYDMSGLHRQFHDCDYLSEEARKMSIEELGAYHIGATMAASDAGIEATRDYYDQFRDLMLEKVQQQYPALTHAQAAIFAESYLGDSQRMEQSINELKMDYVQRDEQGQPIMSQGKPVLSKKDEEFTDKMAGGLQKATLAGDRASSYLTGVANYNIGRKEVQ